MCMPCDVRQRASARALILVCNLQGIRWMGAKIALKINVEINTANEWWHVWVILFDIMSRGASNRKHNRKTTHFLRVLGYLRAGILFFFVWFVAATYGSRVSRACRTRSFRLKLKIFSVLHMKKSKKLLRSSRLLWRRRYCFIGSFLYWILFQFFQFVNRRLFISVSDNMACCLVFVQSPWFAAATVNRSQVKILRIQAIIFTAEQTVCGVWRTTH